MVAKMAAPPAPAEPEPSAPEPPAASVAVKVTPLPMAEEVTPLPMPPKAGYCPEAPVVVVAETAVVPAGPWACIAQAAKVVLWRIVCMPVD